MLGGKYVGEGSYGCVFTPVLKCADMADMTSMAGMANATGMGAKAKKRDKE